MDEKKSAIPKVTSLPAWRRLKKNSPPCPVKFSDNERWFVAKIGSDAWKYGVLEFLLPARRSQYRRALFRIIMARSFIPAELYLRYHDLSWVLDMKKSQTRSCSMGTILVLVSGVQVHLPNPNAGYYNPPKSVWTRLRAEGGESSNRGVRGRGVAVHPTVLCRGLPCDA